MTIARQTITKATEMISPLCEGGEWASGEALLASAVIAQGIYDALHDDSPCEILEQLEPWCLVIGVRKSMAREIYDGLVAHFR